MSRIDADDLEAVLDDDSTISKTPFIRAASALTDYVNSCDSDSVLNDALLTEIETYLAAHFYNVRDQAYDSRKTADASGVFQTKHGMYLDGTDAGQAAIMLDVSGCLSKLNREAKEGGKRKLGVAWLGTTLVSTNTGT